MKKIYFLAFLFLCTFLTIGTNTAWGETVTYTVSQKDAVTITGTAPTGSSASYLQTFDTPKQITKNNSATLTLSGFEGEKITGIVLNMRSNKGTGGGRFEAKAGSTIIASLPATTFNKWYNNKQYTNLWTDVMVTLTNDNYAIQTGEKVVITIAATVSSLYIQSYAITYTSAATSCTTPTFTIADKTISLSEVETVDYDMSTNLTIDKGDSTGAITYSCDNSDVLIDGNTFYTDKAGIYTINATMAADATYCEATTTFTITVQAASCTTLATPTGLTVSDLTPTSAVLKWDAVSNAAKYQIITTPPIFGANNTYETNEITYTANSLTPETTYTWTVKALGNGTTYCDSEKSANATFTTPAKPTYTITWSSPTYTIAPTSVTQGDKIGTLPPAPAAPQGCPDKVFMGWSATNIGTSGTDNAPTFITAQTIPTDNTTYYAVFATKERSGVAGWTLVTSESDLIAGQIYTIASSKTPNSGKVLGKKSTNNYDEADWTSVSTIPTQLTLGGSANAWTLNDGTGYLYAASSSKNYLQTQSTNDQNGQWSITFSSNAAIIKAQGTNTHNVIKYNSSSKLFSCYTGGQSDVYLFKYSAGSTYTDYVTNCVDCTAPTTPLALSVADATLNLGEDGTAKTTFSTTVGNGGKIDYVVNPTTANATLDKDNKTITFTQAGTYTLTAQQDLNTTDGTTYCGSRVSQTITVTKNPVLYFTTIPADPIEFPEVECGGNTPLSQKQQISLQGYNLTGDVAVAVTGDYKIARTASAALSDYTTEFTLPKTIAGKINATYSSVYVLSCPPAQSNSATNGTLTITTDKGNTLTVNLSTPTVTCDEYTLTLNDRGSKKEFGSYYAGAMVSQPADPTGVCTEPINYVFDGWATAEVANGSTTYTPVSFPYTMPKNNTTLYAVYKYTEGEGISKVSAADIVDGGKYYITATYNDTEYMLKAGAFTKGNSAGKTVPFNEETATEDMAWTFVKSNNGWSIQSGANKLGTTDSNTGLSSSISNSKIWTIEATTVGSTTVKLTYSLYGRNLALYQDKDWRTYTADKDGVQAIQLYSATAYSYTTSPVCGPYIKATGDIAITSGKGIWVESVTPLTISAKNLDKNDDNAAVTITATVTDDAAAQGFSIKTPGTQGAGSKSIVTLVSKYTKATLDTALVVVYTPTDHDQVAEGKIALRVYKSGASATYATDTIVVRGRSLPTEFVLAAKTANGWVALPSDLAVGSTGALKSPYAISVDNDATPTKATEAPETAIWSADARSAANKLATALRLKNANNQHLQGSKSNKETNVWLSNQNSDSTQSWELRGADFTHYFVRMHASETGRYLSYDATQGKIGNYKQEASLHILPVEKTCVRFDAPKLDVHTLASTYATLLWEAIAGVAEYEYSLDNGATWQTCTDVQTMGTAIQWMFSGLNTETEYIVWVRAKVADGESNCSDYDSKTFTTTFCDDVPTDLWSSATANSVTIMWNAKAATATVKIYSDDKGENEVQSVPNLSSPAKIGGLTPNTKYYFQVLADGSCASAIDNFLTESNEVSIVEWEKEAVIVDINTDVSDADDVSILVENQTTHGSNNKNIADDLFFSKYYEASGELKLVAIYNGTRDTLPLTNIQLKVGTSKWNTTIQMNQYGKFKAGHIAPDEEIIIWHKSKNTSTNKCVASTMDVRIMDENTSLSFGGRASIGLFRSGDLIDIIGAGTIATSIEGTCKPSWGDANGWCGSGYNIEKNTEEIELSTNRCLLVRSNKVKSGANAVANNTSTFATFTKEEWLGRQVPDDDDTEETVSCEGFAYVADFNYNDYYTTYDSVAKLEIKGNRNADGTYTIPVPRMDTMACTNMRLQLKKAGVVIASREYKVPIVVDKSIDTKNATYFGGSKLTDEVCATCDVVVRDKARLEHVEGGKQQFREMYVYAGSTFTIPEGQKMTLDKVRMFACNDSVSYAIINNSDATDAAISVKEVNHIKRIDGKYWYPFSLPYDCNIADIDQLSGQTLGVYGEDWGIKFYDGKRRQSDGNSTTHYGEVSKYWTMMPENGVLKAYTGYIIGLFYPDENLMRSVNFPPATLSAYTEDATSKTTPITNWPYNLTAQPRHHGWNFVGSPYISLFGAAENEGLYNAQVKMGWTDAYGEQQDKEHIYVSIPDGGNSNTYTQALASGVTIKPFTAYFVQAIDPTNNQSNTLSLTYSKANRHLLASPARVQNASPLILAELDIRCGALHDNAGVLVSDDYSTEYEIGDDLYKMYAAAAKPQLYTIDANSEEMAYQALPDPAAHAVPLGIYLPAAGDYTLSLNRYVSRLEAAEAVYLLHNGAVVANLLLSDYTVSASAKGTISGYSLDIRRAPEVVTDIVPAAGDAPYIIARDGVLAIANLPADAVVQVYDVLGHRLLQTDTHAAGTLQVPVPQTGVYTVVITTADGQQVLKTLLR